MNLGDIGVSHAALLHALFILHVSVKSSKPFCFNTILMNGSDIGISFEPIVTEKTKSLCCDRIGNSNYISSVSDFFH